MEQIKRLFFGIAVNAPWPEDLPHGRLLDEQHRHLTLAFLGNIDYTKLEEIRSDFPTPPFKVGFVAKFDQCLFLPPKHPRVVAWHIEWLEENKELVHFYEKVIKWLQENGLQPDLRHDFTPHVTLARSPFNEKVWRKNFHPLPLILKDIHLYESVGNLTYTPLWSFPILSPFEEMEHTADIAYLIRGETFEHLFQHAQIALAFNFPPLLPYLQKDKKISSLDEVIMELNHVVSYADQEVGCPFKAVSFHSHLETKENIMHWEMIIDV